VVLKVGVVLYWGCECAVSWRRVGGGGVGVGARSCYWRDRSAGKRRSDEGAGVGETWRREVPSVLSSVGGWEGNCGAA